MNDFENYANYFSVGMKVGVGIPLANAGVFRDWAIIQEIDEDLVSIQLSRDQFPLNVSLHVGQVPICAEVRMTADTVAGPLSLPKVLSGRYSSA